MTHWKVHHRLLGCFALVTVLLIGLSAYSVHVTRGIDQSLGANAQQNAVIQRAAIDFRGSVHDRAIALRDAVIAPDMQALQQEQQRIAALAQAYAQAQQHLHDVIHAQRDHLPAQVQPMLQEIARQEQLGLGSADRIMQALQRGDRTEAETVLWTQTKPQYAQWLASINQLIDFEEARIGANNRSAQQAANSFGLAMLLVTALAVIASMGAAGLLARSITRELGAEPHEVRRVVQALQAGQLTVDVPVRTGDRLSVMAAVAAMQQHLHALVSAVYRNIHHLRTTGGEISQGNAQLGERTQQTTHNLHGTSAALQALTDTVQHSAQAAQQAQALAGSALEAADHGGEVMQQVLLTMQDIASSSQRIEEIIGVIDGIAFQTNILALNAAVEAARAGEQGRGFAVVAAEVRALAGRSAQAAKQIKDLIANSVQRVQTGNGLVEQASTSMQGIVAHVQRVHQIIATMGHTTQEQSQDIVQVNQSMSDLESMTLQNASLVQQSTAAVGHLQAQSQALAQLVASFTVHPTHPTPNASHQATLAQ